MFLTFKQAHLGCMPQIGMMLAATPVATRKFRSVPLQCRLSTMLRAAANVGRC